MPSAQRHIRLTTLNRLTMASAICLLIVSTATANRRADFGHKLSTSVVKEKSTIACETLSLKGMSRTKLAKSVQDAAHRGIFRQIEYKARWRNRNFVFVDRWYPSSQLCSRCGYRHQELSLSDRIWRCPACGAMHDRDHNAAKTSETKELECCSR